MSSYGKDYLKEIVKSIICVPNAFHIHIENGKYIFSMSSKDIHATDYYSMSALYDAIVDLDKKIKFSFFEAVKYDLPETLTEYEPFSKLSEEEFVAQYHIENMVFRVTALWDILAQVCNVKYHTGLEHNKVYYNRYFTNFSSGDKAIDIVKEIKTYIDEKDNFEGDQNPWSGNHAFLNDYRNQMTHRVSPSITSISSFGFSLRPPAMYVLHRITEDYYMVSSFLCRLINEFLEEYKDWYPFSLSTPTE